MIDYISGKLVTLTPTMAVIDNHGIGYATEISLQTYDVLNGKTEAVVYLQRQVNPRDGSEADYGFATQEERELFRQITSVSGMGAASARMVLSSLSAEELRNAILSEDVNRLKAVKGIGLKTAQRLVLELKDKIVKGEAAGTEVLFKTDSGAAAEEASSALQMLGFSKPNINKAIQAILKQDPGASVEEIIKAALKRL
ncbi:MAG: Holliday junction branch migration protein RuvA [Bacteroidales bacterium]|nr:Holliday junction branch migration protein RuvA [Bacteroidales bacterium]